MRGLRKKRDGQWREAERRRVHPTEPKVRRATGDPKSGLMLLGERVSDAIAN